MELQKKASDTKLETVLFYAMELVGFNPENIELNSLDIIITNIAENHKDITIDKFREAFELGANGKLDIDLNTYQNFNTLYVSNVLSAYRRYNQANSRKPKLFELPNPNPTGAEEKERAFYWVKFNFLDESERNGSKGEFPEIIICSWKDAHSYMIEKGMLIELTGLKLEDRLKEIEQIRRIEETDDKKRLANAMSSKAIDTDIKTMLYYKYEVIDYFIANRERLYEQ